MTLTVSDSIIKFHEGFHIVRQCHLTLLAIIDKYGAPISQWTWLYQALLEVSMNKIAL